MGFTLKKEIAWKKSIHKKEDINENWHFECHIEKVEYNKGEFTPDSFLTSIEKMIKDLDLYAYSKKKSLPDIESHFLK